MAAPRNYLTRSALPNKTPHPHGLRSVTEIETAENGHWMFGANWDDSCGRDVFVAPNNCDPLLDPEDLIKESFERMEAPYAGTDDMTLYAFHRCSAVGDAISERALYASDELALGQWHVLEKRFMERVSVFTGYPTGVSGAVNALGVALAQWVYPFTPTVHVTPNVAAVLGSRIVKVDGHLELRTGERVSVGYGYRDIASPTDHTKGLVALTGPVFATLGSERGLGGETIDPATNTYLALVERPFSMGFLCDAVYVGVNDVVSDESGIEP